MSFALVLDSGARMDPRGIADTVAQVFKISKIDARLLVRKSRGILAENVSSEGAQKLAAALEQVGLKVNVVPQTAMPRLPPPSRISFVERAAEDEHIDRAFVDMFVFRRGSGSSTEALAWDQIGTFSAGCVVQPRFQDLFSNIPFSEIPPLRKIDAHDAEMIRANLSLKLQDPVPDTAPDANKKKRPSIYDRILGEFKGKLKAYISLVTVDADDWLLIGAEEFVYKYGSVKMGAGLGFEYLVRDLAQYCDPAACTDVSLKLLQGCDIKDLIFLDLEEFHRFTTWFAVRRRLKEHACPTNESSSPSPAPAEPFTESDSSSSSPGPDSTSTSP